MKTLLNTKSIIGLSLIITLDIIIIKEIHLENDLFLLFSNLTTMVMTYFFVRKKEKDNE